MWDILSILIVDSQPTMLFTGLVFDVKDWEFFWKTKDDLDLYYHDSILFTAAQLGVVEYFVCGC